MNPQPFYDHYKENGFIFSKSVLTRYCLSLYTKPFVILSGISGTGKTKIAQLFNVIEENEGEINERVEEATQKLDKKYVILNITNGLLYKDVRANFKISDLESFFEPDEIDDVYTKIQIAKDRGGDNNIDVSTMISIKEPDGFTYNVEIYLQRPNNVLVRARFKSRVKALEPYNYQSELKKRYEVGDVLKLVKTGPKEFEIESINNELVKEINEVIELQESKLIENKLFISVKSNWTDASEVFGYYNILNDQYQMTDILKFIMKAQEYPKIPFFLILDEMNLSRIEHYFSDYLSSLESRHYEDGILKQEPITLHNFSSYVNSNDDYYDLIPNKIELPINLYITGTVNIDETTYTFSPKVLDRANVIEFNLVNLDTYSTEEEEEDPNDTFVLTDFPHFGEATHASRNDLINTPPIFEKFIGELIDILQPYNLHFGYRVINEMALFLNNSIKYIADDEATITQSIDFQISQKVLPKFSGAFGKLDEPLRKLISFLANEDLDYTSINIDILSKIEVEKSSYPISLAKLISMYKSLSFNGFVSYLG